jgi:hypothetical protein
VTAILSNMQEGGIKHVMRELKKARRSDKLEELGIEIDLIDDSDMSKWRVVFPAKAFGEHILGADLLKHK